MARTFNLGIGGVLVVKANVADAVVAGLVADGEDARVIGGLVPWLDSAPRVSIASLGSALSDTTGVTVVTPPMPPAVKRTAVLISGSGTNLQSLIDSTNATTTGSYPAEIVVVISNVAGVRGLERATKAGIRTVVIDHKAYDSREHFDIAIHNVLVEHRVDVVCLAGFMRIMSAQFVDKWKGRLINIHPALLPSFKGVHAHRQALAAGVRVTGCTVHFVDAGVDTGPIIAQRSTDVDIDDTESSLQEKVKLLEHELYPKALAMVASGEIEWNPDGPNAGVSWRKARS